MCGRFAQAQSRERYLEALAAQTERAIAYDPTPIARYNVAPGTKVLLLNAREDRLHLDAVPWGYAPPWWHKAPLINARVETAPHSRMFRPLWQHGRAIVFADGWFEWQRNGRSKQPYFIYAQDRQPLFLAAIGHTPFDRQDDTSGFVIVTAAADQGLVDIHDRRPLVLTAEAARAWLQPDTGAAEAADIAAEGALPADAFRWHAVTPAVGNVKNQGPSLIAPLQ